MTMVRLVAALCGLALLGACKSPEFTERMDSDTLGIGVPFAMSATRDIREPSQSLAVVAMKDQLAPGETLDFSDRTRAILREYAN